MRAFSFELRPTGLRPDNRGYRGTPFLTVAQNVKVKNKALEYYVGEMETFPTLSAGAVTVDMTMDWPFPQIFHSGDGIFICTRTHLYQLVYASGTWTITDRLAAYTGHNVNWPWTFADFPGTPVFASANVLVYYDRTDAAWYTYDKNNSHGGGSNWSSSWYQPVSICNFRGQYIAVGSKTTTTFPSQARIIRWSDIGRFGWFGHTSDERSNEAGEMYVNADSDEILLRCLPLSTGIVVYGTFHSYFLRPVMDPPTYALDLIGGIGISNPLAVGGDEDMHIIVDRRGCLWALAPMVDPRNNDYMKPKRLGYEEFLYPLVQGCDPDTGTGMVSVVYNKWENEYFISNGTTSYLFNEEGLTQVQRCVSGLLDMKEVRLART